MHTLNPKTVAMIDTLIGFDTVSRNSNLGLIEWVRDYLQRLGVASRLSYDATRAKANLFATLGDARDGGIVLCGHTDVVPVDGQPWDSDPFKTVWSENCVQGRGACDMKSFLACALAAAPMFLAAPLKRPVHLAFTYDEEVGCLGAPVLIRDLQASGLRPAGCIVGEPTLMQVMTRHKGLRVYRCRVQGLEAHSSLAPSGVNAIEYASRLIERVRAIALDLRDQGPRDEGYSVPWMTLSTTMIHGGTASNIIPRECEFRFDMRTLPGIDAEEIVTRLRRYAADELLPEMIGASTEADIRIELAEHAPELATADDSAIAALGARLADNPRLGRVPFATDGGHFQRSGIPTVVIGPGSVEQAHKPNETIAIEQIVQCQRFLDRLKDALCA